VTLPEATFREARKFLRRWGEVHRTGYFHVLTLTVEDVESFPAEVAKAIEGVERLGGGIDRFRLQVTPRRSFDQVKGGVAELPRR
jgi:hypothetical protein